MKLCVRGVPSLRLLFVNLNSHPYIKGESNIVVGIKLYVHRVPSLPFYYQILIAGIKLCVHSVPSLLLYSVEFCDIDDLTLTCCLDCLNSNWLIVLLRSLLM